MHRCYETFENAQWGKVKQAQADMDGTKCSATIKAMQHAHSCIAIKASFDILSSSAGKDQFQHWQSFPAHTEGFYDPLPVEILMKMMRECPYSTKTWEVSGNPSPPPSRFPNTFLVLVVHGYNVIFGRHVLCTVF